MALPPPTTPERVCQHQRRPLDDSLVVRVHRRAQAAAGLPEWVLAACKMASNGRVMSSTLLGDVVIGGMCEDDVPWYEARSRCAAHHSDRRGLVADSRDHGECFVALLVHWGWSEERARAAMAQWYLETGGRVTRAREADGEW